MIRVPEVDVPADLCGPHGPQVSDYRDLWHPAIQEQIRDRADILSYIRAMVASPKALADRFMQPPAPFLAGRWLLPRFTRHDAETLIKSGVIPENASTELLNGAIVVKDRAASGENPFTIGQYHRRCVEQLSALRRSIDSSVRHVESQQPLVCSETHVPEPDFLILRGALADYTDLPTASDAYCVVEVADASYERDAGEKLAAYASAGIAQYIIINLRNRTAEIYTNPNLAAGTYPPPQIISENSELSLRAGQDELIAVPMKQILP